ncbi:MAG TPA: DUF4157 domain-containing protein [Roseiflexaceae bacterium]|nr:DUF4157 domain-containing protein [Roseiflexaceae bacterium]
MSHTTHSKRKPSDTTPTWTQPTTETATPSTFTPSSSTPSQAEQSVEAEHGAQEPVHSLHHFGNISLFAPEPQSAPAAPPAGGDGFGNQTNAVPLIQASLRVNAPDDTFEQEAESVADMVMRSPAPSGDLDIPTDPSAALHVQRASGEGTGLSASPSVETNIAQMQSGGGSPIPASDRSFFENRFGHDFSQIRIHTDSRAVETSRSLNARAFTVGTDIAFDAGEYQPGTASGRHLLAHELTHTIQQTGGIATKRIQRQTTDEEEAVAEPEEMPSPENAAAEAIATFNPADAEREREEPIEGEEATLAGEESEAVDTSGGSEPNVSAPSGGAGAPAPEGAEAQASAPVAGAPQATAESAAPAAKAGPPGGALEQAQKAAQEALTTAQQGAAQAANQAQAKGGAAEQASQPTTDAAPNTTTQSNGAQASSAQPDTAKAEATQTERAEADAKPKTNRPADTKTNDAQPDRAQADGEQTRDQRADEVDPAAEQEPEDERERPMVQRSARGPVFIQRKAGDGAPASAQEDPAFQAVVAQSQQAATQQKQHAPAEQKADESAAAAKMPQEEKTGQAQNTQSAGIEAAADSQATQAQDGSAPGFDKAAFVASVRARIDELTPQDPKEMENIEGSGVFSGTKQVVDEKVQSGKQQAQGNVDDKVKESPDPSSVAEKPTTPLQPNAPGQQPTIDANGAAPKPKSEAAVEQPLQAESKQLDDQMAQAQVTPELLQSSNEPTFQQADAARTEAQAKVATDLPAYRSSEQGKIQGAQAEARTAAEAGMQGMFGARAQQFGQLDGVQSTGQTKDEQKRAEIGRQIDGIYQSTKTEVESILKALDSQVDQVFNAGADQAKQAAVDYIKRETQAFKDARYNKDADWWRVDQHVAGAATWVGDQIVGMPPEYYEYYKHGRDLYVQQMDVVLGRVADVVGDHLTRAKARIAQGRKQIEDFIAKQPADLREVAQEIANDALGKFDELEQTVDAKQQELVDKLAEQYTSKLQELDSELEAMKEADKGLLAKARDLVTGVLDTIAQLKGMLESVLASAASVITQIIQNPMQFLSNLLSGIGQGLRQFVGNIGSHLQKGLIEWLTGSLAGAGIQLPATWDLAGIFQLVLQIFGLTYAQIRQRIIQALGPMGEAVIGALEQAWEVFQIIQTEGLAGLWRFISSQVGDLQAMVMDEIKSLIANEVIKAGIEWLIGVLGGPAGAFIKAVQSIVRVVTWVMNNAGRMMSLVQAVVDGVAALAGGNVGALASKVEQGLATAVPMAISFLAGLLGLGNLPARVQGIIQKVRKPIESGIQWLIKQAKALGKKLLNKLGGKDKDKAGKADNPDKQQQIDAGLQALHSAEAGQAKEGKLSKEGAEQAATNTKQQHPVFSSISVIKGNDRWKYNYVVQRMAENSQFTIDDKDDDWSAAAAAHKAAAASSDGPTSEIQRRDGLVSSYNDNISKLETNIADLEKNPANQDDVTWKKDMLAQYRTFLADNNKTHSEHQTAYERASNDLKEYAEYLQQAQSGKDSVASSKEFVGIFNDLKATFERLKKQLAANNRALEDKATRIMFATGKHTPATEYKKHVVGATNEAREKNAAKNGQYYRTDENGQTVTDERIKQWERDGLQNGTIDPGRSDGTYHVYYEAPERVGYAAPDKKGGEASKSRSVRVEYSSGEIHSHPREIPDKVKKRMRDDEE